MGQVDGKVALVTGGGSGIGAACAIALAREGAAVMVTDIDAEGGRATVDAIAAAGGTAAFEAHDVTDEERWIAVIQATVERFGRLDVLVNNAGIGVAGPVTGFSLADWRRLMAVNSDGVFLGTKHAIPAMRRSGGGSIVNMSSLAGLQGSPGLSAYCASKGAVRLFSKAVALECALAGGDVRVNSVHPGIIDTPIWRKEIVGMAPPGVNALDPVALAAMSVPSGKVGLPEDVAAVVLFLGSDASRYVNGAEMVVDGGMHAGRTRSAAAMAQASRG